MISKTLLAAALTAASFATQAATVVYNFQSSAFDSGSLAGQSFSGQFSFDDAALTASTSTLPLLSLSFSLGGQSYTLAQATAGTTGAVFNAGALSGVNAVFSGGSRSVELTWGFGSPYAFYQQSTSNFGFADLSFSTAAVPEPQTYALMLGGLAAVGFIARRRKA
ncbi:MAG: PEP-CTERM sorting domain-containing protein [Burkholderiales bacterium]|nr:MAG: PEP-CTERM sorting domain-containing protein [Burkholderiales bacterium]